jgi:hypothetical protein
LLNMEIRMECEHSTAFEADSPGEINGGECKSVDCCVSVRLMGASVRAWFDALRQVCYSEVTVWLQILFVYLIQGKYSINE